MSDTTDPMAALREQQAVFLATMREGGIEVGLAHLLAHFQQGQMKLSMACGFADPTHHEVPEGTDPELLAMHEGMHEALTQARLRMCEVSMWLEMAANQRRYLAGSIASRKKPPSDDGA